MWLTFMVLFAALTPGVLFTIPSLGKKMGGKVAIAAMHAVLFVIVVNLLNVVQEGFQASLSFLIRDANSGSAGQYSSGGASSNTFITTTIDSLNKSLADAKTAMRQASDSLAEMSKQIDADNSAVVKDTATLNYDNSILQKHTDVYATIKQAIATIQNKMNDIQQQITAAQKAMVAAAAEKAAAAAAAAAAEPTWPGRYLNQRPSARRGG